MSNATITRKMHTGEAGNPGHFGSKDFSDAETSLTTQRPQSAFIDSSTTNQEAADIFFAGRPWSSADDFEDALFDTYDTADEYERDVNDPESALMIQADQLGVYGLPSGGIAVFYQD